VPDVSSRDNLARHLSCVSFDRFSNQEETNSENAKDPVGYLLSRLKLILAGQIKAKEWRAPKRGPLLLPDGHLHSSKNAHSML
jgi:hypothetical protein